MKQLLQISVWLLAIAILVLSVVPADLRPVAAQHNLEHFSIFFIFGVAVALAYPASYVKCALALPAFAALVEIVQLGVPGRHARLGDFLVDALGCLVGLGLAGVARRIILGRRRHVPHRLQRP
jgi:VanZ family protein